MRLGFYYHIPAIRKENAIYVPGFHGRFLDALAVYCETLTLFVHEPDPDETLEFDYPLHGSNIQVEFLPPRGSVPHRFLHLQAYTSPIISYFNQLDAMLLRGPSPLLPAIARASRPLPLIMLIIGDYVAGIDSMPQAAWRKRMIGIWSKFNAYRQRRAARRSLVFVNSNVLYKQYYGVAHVLEETHTTTLNTADLYRREDTCQSRPVNLLYTGRLDPAKGLLDMIEAVHLLTLRGENVILNLVGWPEKGHNILDELKSKAQVNGIVNRVVYHGYHAVGPDLFDFYKKADIYLIASQASEGFPRTIWEAMAHSLPVVATRVGSIPDFVTGAAELTEPRNPQALADAIASLLHDGQKRRHYITAGFELAQQNCLEIQVQKMVNSMRDWLGEN